MKELKGISASSGIAIGVVCVYETGAAAGIEHYSISKKQVDNELKRFKKALDTAETRIKKLKEVSGELFGEQGSDIITAHLSILNDKGLQKKIKDDISENLVNAEHAVEDVFKEYAQKLTGISAEKAHFEEITHDIADVRDRLLDSFKGSDSGQFKCPVGEKKPVVVAAKRLTPSMVINISRKNTLAFVAEKGGVTAHASILARTLGIPVIVGIDIEGELECRCQVIVDGALGKVIVEPDRETVQKYRKKKEKSQKRREMCKITLHEPTRTAQGRRINLKVNISTMGELELLKNTSLQKENSDTAVHYDGVGLLRTEFIFMNEKKPPEEEYQLEIYKNILQSAGNRPVVARMMDISEDKIPDFIDLPSKINPGMNLRGASAVLTFRDIYLTQARAMLRAAGEGKLKILFPMVSDSE
ncbi:MAG: putative PEP-binding protein, partial [Elusimicrobiota bacterium]